MDYHIAGYLLCIPSLELIALRRFRRLFCNRLAVACTRKLNDSVHGVHIDDHIGSRLINSLNHHILRHIGRCAVPSYKGISRKLRRLRYHCILMLRNGLLRHLFSICHKDHTVSRLRRPDHSRINQPCSSLNRQRHHKITGCFGWILFGMNGHLIAASGSQCDLVNIFHLALRRIGIGFFVYQHRCRLPFQISFGSIHRTLQRIHLRIILLQSLVCIHYRTVPVQHAFLCLIKAALRLRIRPFRPAAHLFKGIHIRSIAVSILCFLRFDRCGAIPAIAGICTAITGCTGSLWIIQIPRAVRMLLNYCGSGVKNSYGMIAAILVKHRIGCIVAA